MTHDPSTGAGRPARPRESSLLDDKQRAAFLAEWSTVQTGLIRDPQGASEAAERLVAEVADSIVRRIGEITEAAGRREADMSGEESYEERCRRHVLRCREAFRLLIDS